VKVAVTDLLWFMLTVHVPVPVHAPLQPLKVEVPDGTAVKVTDVFLTYGSEQSAPQLIPTGLLVTVPVLVPAFVTVRMTAWASTLNAAVTDLAESIVTVHVPVPVQAPDQPAKTDAALGVAVRVTELPGMKSAEHAGKQFTPAGLLVTIPLPPPSSATDSVTFVLFKRTEMSSPPLFTMPRSTLPSLFKSPVAMAKV
jgi:hypothetical protein